MNRITITAFALLFLSLPLGLLAQSNGIDRYYETYRQDDRFTVITVSSKMFSLFVNFERDDPDEQQIIETISKLKGLKMLVAEELDNANSVFKEAVKKPNSGMEELMTISDANKDFRFFITESGGMISELLMVGYEENQMIILSLVGDIDLKEIAKLSQKMDIEGFEHLKNIQK